MKKRRSIIAIALALVMLSGCESGGATLSNDSSAVSSESGQYVESSADESSKAENSKAESSDTESSDTESSDTESSKAETSKEESSADNKTSSAESNSGDTKEWKETPTSGTKYVTVDCYSRKNAIIGSDKVDLHTYGSSVKVVAKTDTDYYKLSDGSFIHQDYLSDSKPVKTEPPKTTAKPQTQKPASGSTDKTDGYTWVIQPQYNYDDVEILRQSNYLPSGEGLLVSKSHYEQGVWMNEPGTLVKNLFAVKNKNKYGLINSDAKLLIDFSYDKICASLCPPGIYFITVSDITYENGYEHEDYKWLNEKYQPVEPTQGFGVEGYPHYFYDVKNGDIYCDREWVDTTKLTDKNMSNLYVPVTSATVRSETYWNEFEKENQTNYYFDTDKSGVGKCGLLSNGKITVPVEYDGFFDPGPPDENFFGDNRIVFFKNKKIYVFDKKGKCYSKGVYDKVDNRNQELYYLNGYLPVCKNNKWGLIDVNGKEVLSCQFEDITSVYDGKAWAKQNGKWGVIALN